MPPRTADITALLRALVEHEVDFIVVGGVCAVLHGAPVSTFDLDIVPERSQGNIDRLIRAHMTTSGPLDVLGEIGAHRDYAKLVLRSSTVEVGVQSPIRVLDMDALIETKREAGRPKDLATLPVLERTLEESKRAKG